MNVDILKETIIEHCENMYALSIGYLKKYNNIELEKLLKELEILEDKIRLCDNLNIIEEYKVILEQLIKRIEEIINE